jgi:hypothetical protein
MSPETVLSSNLVYTMTLSDEAQHMHMALVSDFWKFPLWSFTLISITLLATFTWWKYWSQVRERASRLLRILN